MTEPLRLSTGQREALEALVKEGSEKAAAYALGITLSALQHRLTSARVRNSLTTYQLCAALGAEQREADLER
jgi:hypothetical protein